MRVVGDQNDRILGVGYIECPPLTPHPPDQHFVLLYLGGVAPHIFASAQLRQRLQLKQ